MVMGRRGRGGKVKRHALYSVPFFFRPILDPTLPMPQVARRPNPTKNDNDIVNMVDTRTPKPGTPCQYLGLSCNPCATHFPPAAAAMPCHAMPCFSARFPSQIDKPEDETRSKLPDDACKKRQDQL